MNTVVEFDCDSSLSFGFSRLRVATADNLDFYKMAFVLRSDVFSATNPLFG